MGGKLDKFLWGPKQGHCAQKFLCEVSLFWANFYKQGIKVSRPVFVFLIALLIQLVLTKEAIASGHLFKFYAFLKRQKEVSITNIHGEDHVLQV